MGNTHLFVAPKGRKWKERKRRGKRQRMRERRAKVSKRKDERPDKTMRQTQ